MPPVVQGREGDQHCTEATLARVAVKLMVCSQVEIKRPKMGQIGVPMAQLARYEGS